ncbi:MAG: putative IcmP-like type secretion system protein [Alphaproteobacteria bacterium]|nr:putative IcmP-like type secretion system protein [Alphaproteobacteria bacterium]
MADKSKDSEERIIALILATIFLLCFVFWLAMSEQISGAIRWLRVFEFRLGSPFTDKYDRLLTRISRMRASDIRPTDLLVMSQASSDLIKVPVAIMLALMGVGSMLFRSKHPYARKFDLEGLAKEQASAFPVTAPIVKFNPLKENFRAPGHAVPEKLPPFAEALTPEEWVSHNSIPVTDGVIDRDSARIAFAKQLGGRWKSVNDLPLYAQALFAAFSMKANGMRTESDEFLGEIAQCWEPGKGLLLTRRLRKQVKQKIADPKFGRVTEKIAALHSFIVPAMVRCLYMAREQGGVLAPAQFIWLRAVDRHLWYALNNLGRSSTHPEGSGSLAHYRSEKAAGKPIPNPQVDTAIEGLISYLTANDITQFPAKEYARK